MQYCRYHRHNRERFANFWAARGYCPKHLNSRIRPPLFHNFLSQVARTSFQPKPIGGCASQNQPYKNTLLENFLNRVNIAFNCQLWALSRMFFKLGYPIDARKISAFLRGQSFSTLVASPRPTFLEYIVNLLIHLVDFV